MADNNENNRSEFDGERIARGIEEWVAVESPTNDRDAVNAMADHVQAECEKVGLKVERTPGEDGWGDLVRARTDGANGGEKGILVLSHIDTVHPVGTKDGDNRIRREGDKLYGPGIHDMKAGAYLAYCAYARLVGLGRETALPVTFMYIPEEEIGSPYSRKFIEQEAHRAKYVLVPEPSRDGGKAVVARKGVARFVIKATGRPAHSGGQHEDGRSSIKELAHQIIAIEALTDYQRGVTFNVGLINGGTGVNVVPRQCRMEVDMRVVSTADGEEFCARIHALRPNDPDVSLEITGGMNRPPFELSDATKGLFDFVRAVSLEHDFDLRYTTISGGGSDGNFTAALGVATLDGMGADGVGAHTLHEHILVSSLAPRAQTWMKLLERLE